MRACCGKGSDLRAATLLTTARVSQAATSPGGVFAPRLGPVGFEWCVASWIGPRPGTGADGSTGSSGVSEGIRTPGRWSHNPELYQLSYAHHKNRRARRVAVRRGPSRRNHSISRTCRAGKISSADRAFSRPLRSFERQSSLAKCPHSETQAFAHWGIKFERSRSRARREALASRRPGQWTQRKAIKRRHSVIFKSPKL